MITAFQKNDIKLNKNTLHDLQAKRNKYDDDKEKYTRI